jgi:hypothetical protein
VKQIDPDNLVFLDEIGVLLGLTRTHARSSRGSRVYDLKPFIEVQSNGGASYQSETGSGIDDLEWVNG